MSALFSFWIIEMLNHPLHYVYVSVYSSYLVITMIGLVSRVFDNGPRGWGSIPGWAIPKKKK